MRDGDWKLMSMGDAPALYNLKTDIGESKDLSATETARFEKMTADWKAWDQKNIPARWVPQGAAGQKKKKGKKA